MTGRDGLTDDDLRAEPLPEGGGVTRDDRGETFSSSDSAYAGP